MRELRDRMSHEFAGITFEEQKRRMDEVLGKGLSSSGGERADMSDPHTRVPAEKLASQEEKPFDCVRFMRQARERISREIAGMNVEEELRWYAEQRAKLDRVSPLPSRDEPRRSA